MAERIRYVYFAQPGKAPIPLTQLEVCKIGISFDPAPRLKDIGARPIFAVPCPESLAPRLERALHEEFRRIRIVNTPCAWMGHLIDGVEWFLIDERLRWIIGITLNLGFWPWDRTRATVVVDRELVRR